MLYHLENKWHIYAKLKCKLGFHKRKRSKRGKIVNKLRCIYCNKPKDHNLEIIDGGKQKFDNFFKF